MLAEKGAALVTSTVAEAGGMPLSVFILLGAVAALFFLALYFGKRRSIATIFALYITSFLFSLFPYWEAVAAEEATDMETLGIRAGVFALLFLGIRMTAVHFSSGSFPDGSLPRWIEALALALFAAALLLFAAYQFFSLESFYTFPSLIENAFTNPKWQFLLLALPLVGLYLMPKRK